MNYFNFRSVDWTLVDHGARVFFVAASALLISAVPARAAAEIDLQQPAGVSIADGGSKDFGTVVYGTDKTLTFIIRNTGNAALNLTGNPRVVIGGTHAADFTVISQPVSSLPAAAQGGPVTVLNSGFETPVQGAGAGYTYRPTGAGWTFTGESGVARSGTSWFSGWAAEGSQAGFIYYGASISQVLNFPATGDHVIRFYIIRRADGSPNTIDVRMDGSTIGTVLNSEQSDDLWRTFDMPYTCTVAGNHTLAFVGTITNGGVFSSAVDNVQVFPKIYETPFQVRFTPGGGGTRTATVSIANDDSNENPYNLTLTGTTPIQTKIAIEQPAGARLTNGMVRSWGCNPYGETDVPPGLVNVKGIAAGGYHTVVVKADRTVAAWGLSTSTAVPVDLSNVAAVAAGAKHTMALRTDGTIVVWGDNTVNQTVVPAGLTDAVAIAAANDVCAALRSNGTVVTWGDFHGVQPAGLTDVKAIAVGKTHALALRSNGTVVAWGGQNFQGQADVPSGLANVVAIAAGGNGSAAVKSDGTIVQWGNYWPEPAGLNGVVALAASSGQTLALRNDATIVGWGYNSCGQANVPADVVGTRAVAVSSKDDGGQSVALLDSTVNFGNQTVGIASAAKTFTIRNTGLAPLTISGVSVSGGDAANFTVNTSGMLTTISTANGTTTFTVAFTPGSTGQKHTTLRVMNNEPDQGTFYVHLTGTGIPAVPEIAGFTGATTNAAAARTNNVGTHAFSNLLVGATSSAQTFTIKNIGFTNLTGLALAKAGANPGDFAVSSLGSTTLAPQATTTFTVTFSPTAGGTRSAVVNIASNDGDENPFGINVTGTGIPAVPEIAVFTGATTNAANERVDGVGTHNFPNTIVGANSAPQTFTIKNIGTANLTGLALTKTGANPGDFVVGSLGSTTLAPQATTTFTVTFAPSIAGTRNAVVNIASNDGDENPFRIQVGGTATTEASALVEASIHGDTIVATSANSPAPQGAANAIDNTVTNKYLNFDKLNTGMTITPTGKRPVRALTLISAEDAPERDPSSFVVEASNDGTNFTRIASNAVPAFSTRHFVQSIAFPNTNVFNVYRVLFPTVSDEVAANSMQIAEVELLYWPEITSPNDAVSITLPPGAVDVRGVGSLFDRQLDGIHKLEVAPIAGGNTIVHVIPGAGSSVLKGFELIGAADDFLFPQRRPSRVVVAGSNDGTNYTNLATMTPAAPSSNLQIQEFSTSSNLTAFARYRITFGPPVSGDRIQVGEMRLFGEIIPVVLPPLLSVRSSGNSVLVSWPDSPGFILETRADLNGTSWTTVATAPVLSNGVNTVTLPATGSASFFHLRK